LNSLASVGWWGGGSGGDGGSRDDDGGRGGGGDGGNGKSMCNSVIVMMFAVMVLVGNLCVKQENCGCILQQTPKYRGNRDSGGDEDGNFRTHQCMQGD
jgi:hypothetical protein